MACVIRIFPPVTGIKNSAGDLVSILVTGQANCDRVEISIDCGGVRVTDFTDVHNSVWSKSVFVGRPEIMCGCDRDVVIEVRCQNDDSCGDSFKGVLHCEFESDCPFIYSDLDSIGECENGKRRQHGFVVAHASGKTYTLEARIDGTVVGSTTVAAGQGGAVEVNELLTPGSHFLKWTSHPTCQGSGQTIQVPPCEGCPAIEPPKITIGACKNGKREVTIEATIPDQGVDVTAAIKQGGTILAQDTKSGAYTLAATGLFGAGNGAVTVEILSPAPPPRCPPTEINFNVPPCAETPPPIVNGGGRPDDDDGEGGWGCIIGRLAVVLLFAAAIFLTVLGLCVPPPANTPILIAAGVALGLAAITFSLWSALCGNKCGRLLIVWQSALLGFWLTAYLWGCCPWAGAVMGGLGALAAAMFYAWVKECRPTVCRAIIELLWVTTVPAATMLSILGKILPCGLLMDVVGINSTVAAVLSVALYAGCKK